MPVNSLTFYNERHGILCVSEGANKWLMLRSEEMGTSHFADLQMSSGRPFHTWTLESLLQPRGTCGTSPCVFIYFGQCCIKKKKLRPLFVILY